MKTMIPTLEKPTSALNDEPPGMVNTQLLKEHAKQYKITKDTAGEFHRQMFTLFPETAIRFDAEDLDPDSIPRSRKFQMIGGAIIRNILNLPYEFEEQINWKSTIANIVSIHKEMNVPFAEFQKGLDSMMAAFKSVGGGYTPEQATEWKALFEEVYKTMADYGYQ